MGNGRGDEDSVRDAIHQFNGQGLAAPDSQFAGGRPGISNGDVEVIVAAAATPGRQRYQVGHFALGSAGMTPFTNSVHFMAKVVYALIMLIGLACGVLGFRQRNAAGGS
jgi:hypothetical protein